MNVIAATNVSSPDVLGQGGALPFTGMNATSFAFLIATGILLLIVGLVLSHKRAGR